MAVPKQHRSKSRQGQRRMHLGLKPAALVLCPKCGSSKEPHAMCQDCGFYRGRQVIDVLAKLDKKERKKREKEMKEKEREKEKEKEN